MFGWLWRRNLAVIPQPQQQIWMPTARAINLEELIPLLATKPAVVLHCWAEWNGVDRMMDSTWKDLMPRLTDRCEVRSLEIDIPANGEACLEWGVRGVPRTVCFHHGLQVATRCYYMDPPTLEAWLATVFSWG